MTPDRGFSLLECLVATLLACIVLAGLLMAIVHGTRLVQQQPVVVDLDQRLRVAHSTIQRALENAGAGAVAATLEPSLAGRIPAVFPARRGLVAPDGPSVAVGERFTAVLVGADAWEAPLAVSMGTVSSLLLLDTGPPCPPAGGRCGFGAGDLAILSDRSGAFDLLQVRTATAGVVDHSPASLTQTYSTDLGARLAGVRVRQFGFDAARRQLRAGDGTSGDLPLLDDVEGLECEYYGTAAPPTEPRPPLGLATCLFDADGSPRLPSLAAAASTWVELPLDLFRDGPFCGSGAMQYDADLLRVRRVVVRVRVRAGPGAPIGGGALSALSSLGDVREVVVDATIRNLDGH